MSAENARVRVLVRARPLPDGDTGASTIKSDPKQPGMVVIRAPAPDGGLPADGGVDGILASAAPAAAARLAQDPLCLGLLLLAHALRSLPPVRGPHVRFVRNPCSSSWEKHYPGPTLVAVGSGRRSGGAGERARAEGAWLRRPPLITG